MNSFSISPSNLVAGSLVASGAKGLKNLGTAKTAIFGKKQKQVLRQLRNIE